MKQLKNKPWIIVLMAAALLFFNIFVQSKSSGSFRYYLEFEPQVRRCIEKKEIPVLTEETDEPIMAKANSSLNLNLKLLGTIVGSPCVAFILNLDSGKCRSYRLNEEISSAQLVSISSGRVVFQKQGLRQELSFKPGLGAPRRHGDNSALAAVSDSSDKIIISKSQARNQMTKVNELFSKMKVSPVSSHIAKKLKGFRIGNVPLGSIVEQAGIKSGDIICSVQGRKIESTKDALIAFNSVRKKSNIKLTLLRNGRPITLRYEIKE